jgi:hypothetical protein
MSLHKLAVFYGMGDPKEVYQSFYGRSDSELRRFG